VKKENKRTRRHDNRPVIVIVIGLIVGTFLISLGILNSVNSRYDELNVKTEEELRADVEEKTRKYEDLREKRQEEYDRSALSDEYDRLSREMSMAEGALYDAEAELFRVQSGSYDSLKAEKYISSMPLIISGFIVVVLALGIAMKINASKKKNVILTITEEK
jgi:cytochrome c biogenesis factor